MEVINYIGLWNPKLTWYSPSTTFQICRYALEHSLRIHSFRLTWPCLIVKVLATQAKFLKPSGYCLHLSVPELNYVACSAVQLSKLYIECSNASTIMILPTTADIFHSLNWFSHMIYAWHTSMYQNMYQLFTYPSYLQNSWICINISFQMKNNNKKTT